MVGTICVLFFLVNLAVGQDIGERCTADNFAGTCQNINNCPQVIQHFQQTGIFPTNCGYDGSIPIVCCIDRTAAKPTTNKPTTRSTVGSTRGTTTPKTTTAKTAATKRPTKRPQDYAVGELSKEKCIEYGTYVFEEVLPPIPIPGQAPINVSVCGFKSVPLIIGGIPAVPYEFPHQALLGFQNGDEKSWQCGGTLISDRFVLSAAHCASSSAFGAVKYVRLGELDYGTDKDNARPQDFTIVETIKHPEWKPPLQYNDIMLLKLDKPVKFDKYIRPACLHTTFEIGPTNSMSNVPRYIATGWGRIEYGGDVSTRLMKVVLDAFSHDQCSTTYKTTTKRRLPDGIREKSQLCSGGMDEDKDTCQGDSGGPLQIYSKVYCMYELVGITSFGKTCGIRLVPGVYTRVSEYIDWIEKIVWKTSN